MCGILGTNIDTSEAHFKKALKTLELRGPDIQQYQKESTFSFGHARLAIVDLDERSNQPFEYEHENKKIVVIFNGEIYNFHVIKEELVALGYAFRTNSDTEVLAAAYIAWNTKCFDKLIGMWAAVIYEKDTKKMIFSRDRVGKKPLYIFDENKGDITFSSTLKALKTVHNATRYEINDLAVELYFALGFIPEEHSIYKNIYKVKPGEIIEYAYKNEGYYRINTLNSVYTPKSNNGSIDNTIELAVKNRMLSDVPYCALLSSGVDSTIISYYCKKNNKNIEAFTVGFDDPKLNELAGAKKIANTIDIKLNEVFLNNQDISDAFKEYYDVYEEPFADYSGIPTIALFKKIGKHYRLAFTGDGGDELFYGYPHYSKKYMLYVLNRIQNILPFITHLLPKKLKGILTCKKEEIESEYLKLNFNVTDRTKAIIDSVFSDILKHKKNFLRATIDYDRKLNNLPEKYLVKVDRASMHSSVEVRSPFMDEDLKSKMDTFPLWKIFTPFSLKLFLKLKYIKLFGIKYLFAKKKGFTPPIKELITSSFVEADYNNFKSYIKTNNLNIYKFYENKTFSDLKRSKLQLYRVYFFSKWLKSQNII